LSETKLLRNFRCGPVTPAMPRAASPVWSPFGAGWRCRASGRAVHRPRHAGLGRGCEGCAGERRGARVCGRSRRWPLWGRLGPACAARRLPGHGGGDCALAPRAARPGRHAGGASASAGATRSPPALSGRGAPPPGAARLGLRPRPPGQADCRAQGGPRAGRQARAGFRATPGSRGAWPGTAVGIAAGRRARVGPASGPAGPEAAPLRHAHGAGRAPAPRGSRAARAATAPASGAGPAACADDAPRQTRAQRGLRAPRAAPPATRLPGWPLLTALPRARPGTGCRWRAWPTGRPAPPVAVLGHPGPALVAAAGHPGRGGAPLAAQPPAGGGGGVVA
jgi:hypothetical protein